jgi:MFS family permease
MYATGILAFVALILTTTFYRAPPGLERAPDHPLRFWLPPRQLVHISIVGLGWTLYNTTLILFVSFTPDVLVGHGYEPSIARSTTSLAMWAMLVSVPLGGRVLEVFGWVTVSTMVALSLAAVAMVAVSQGIAPEVLSVAFGVFAGIPAGALMALSTQALSADNRGPGLGIFYTWYYVGMTIGPALAGWTREVSGSTAAPVILGAALFGGVIFCVGVLRLLQNMWPINTDYSPARS